MAIRRDVTPVEALGKLAIRAGEAQAAEKARQIARQKLNAKLQVEQEQRRIELTAQIDLETFKRSKLWELEKMELRSRSEFALQEKKWLQKEEEKQAKLKKLDEARQQGYIDEDEYKRIWTEIEMGVKLPTPKKEDGREKLEADYGYYLGITNTFKEDADINPGFGKTIVPLASVDKKGEPVREATPEEKTLYDYAKGRLGQLSPVLGGVAAPEQELTADDEKKLAALSEMDKVNFRKILEEGNPDKIRTALSRLRAR